uniref:Uncharacterized protein n=1 Tax=Amphimedon queenslandica TaxID=400682 RepID=A0A1X7V3Z5_AMPQE
MDTDSSNPNIDIYDARLVSRGVADKCIYLQYVWNIPDAPSDCTCGQCFSLDHDLSCPACCFPSICHNEACDITATLLSEFFSNVEAEPHLQPLTYDHFLLPTTNHVYQRSSFVSTQTDSQFSL